MMNIYTGNAVLDESGAGVVQLPSWFEALNTDFRYQLTAVGGPGPCWYVAQEIQNNSFRIAGGTSGLKVSWQVTGVRQDAFARANPLVVEVEKSERERGYYIHPQLFGQSPEKEYRVGSAPPANENGTTETSRGEAEIGGRQRATSGTCGESMQRRSMPCLYAPGRLSGRGHPLSRPVLRAQLVLSLRPRCWLGLDGRLFLHRVGWWLLQPC